MGALTKDAILACVDLKREAVEVPEWGGTVWVRELTAGEMDAWEQYCVDLRASKLKDTIPNIRAQLLVKCVCTEAGERLFTDKEAERLGGKSSRALRILWDAALKINGLGKDEVEAIEGN